MRLTNTSAFRIVMSKGGVSKDIMLLMEWQPDVGTGCHERSAS